MVVDKEMIELKKSNTVISNPNVILNENVVKSHSMEKEEKLDMENENNKEIKKNEGGELSNIIMVDSGESDSNPPTEKKDLTSENLEKNK